MRDKKLYFAGGVIAAFECKLTLHKNHLKSVFENSAKIKKMLPPRGGSPYDELHQPPIFGVLAHSSTWKKKNETALGTAITDCCYKFCQHPRELPDLFCISDVSSYLNCKRIHIGPYCSKDGKDIFEKFDKDGGVDAGYIWGTESSGDSIGGETLGMMIYYLTKRMAFEDPSLRRFAEYLDEVDPFGCIGLIIPFKKTVLSAAVIHRLIEKGYGKGRWSKWQQGSF